MMLFDVLSKTTSLTSPIFLPEASKTSVSLTLRALIAEVCPEAVVMRDYLSIDFRPWKKGRPWQGTAPHLRVGPATPAVACRWIRTFQVLDVEFSQHRREFVIVAAGYFPDIPGTQGSDQPQGRAIAPTAVSTRESSRLLCRTATWTFNDARRIAQMWIAMITRGRMKMPEIAVVTGGSAGI